jgi:thymidylate synthase (FAD)
MIEDGIAPEQARFILPQGSIVNWVWTGNILAFSNFVNKRTDSNAQQEIKQVALAVDKLIKPLYPLSWAALTGDR